jgi:hypothetical protein
MADAPTFSTRLWSELCEEADPSREDDTEYEFSNGRKFKKAG